MYFVRARNNKNKMQIFDNRLLAIDIKIMKDGIMKVIFDLGEGELYECNYIDYNSFNNQWEFYNGEREYEFYDIINYYQE